MQPRWPHPKDYWIEITGTLSVKLTVNANNGGLAMLESQSLWDEDVK